MSRLGFVYLSMCLLALPRNSWQDPVITSITGEQIKNIGDSVKLSCTVHNVDNFSLAWNKRNRERPTDSVVLAIKTSLSLNDPRYKVVELKNDSATIYTLEITKVETVDMGIYECQVITSASQKVTANVEVLVKHPPIISETHTTALVSTAEGLPAQLVCTADGYPRPTISWKREQNAIMPNGGHIYNGNKMKISAAHRADRGTYYCVADNGVGEPDEKLVIFEVEFPPQISVPRPKIAQAPSYDVDLECRVEAHPAPAVLWFKNGVQLTSNSNYQIKTIASPNGLTSSTVTVISVDRSDYGDYFCNATNKMGHADSRINLFESILHVPSSSRGK